MALIWIDGPDYRGMDAKKTEVILQQLSSEYGKIPSEMLRDILPEVPDEIDQTHKKVG